MTALATVAGMLPLSFAIGAGSQMLQALSYRGHRRGADFDGAVPDYYAGCALLLDPKRFL